MKVFRYNKRTYLVFILVIPAGLVFQYLWGNVFSYYSYRIADVISVFFIFGYLFTYIVVDNNGITLKKIYKSTTMHWNDIDKIAQVDPNKIVVAGKKIINISTSIKDYELLLKLIVDNVANNGTTRIDSVVSAIIKNRN